MREFIAKYREKLQGVISGLPSRPGELHPRAPTGARPARTVRGRDRYWR